MNAKEARECILNIRREQDRVSKAVAEQKAAKKLHWIRDAVYEAVCECKYSCLVGELRDEDEHINFILDLDGFKYHWSSSGLWIGWS